MKKAPAFDFGFSLVLLVFIWSGRLPRAILRPYQSRAVPVANVLRQGSLVVPKCKVLRAYVVLAVIPGPCTKFTFKAAGSAALSERC